MILLRNASLKLKTNCTQLAVATKLRDAIMKPFSTLTSVLHNEYNEIDQLISCKKDYISPYGTTCDDSPKRQQVLR